MTRESKEAARWRRARDEHRSERSERGAQSVGEVCGRLRCCPGGLKGRGPVAFSLAVVAVSSDKNRSHIDGISAFTAGESPRPARSRLPSVAVHIEALPAVAPRPRSLRDISSLPPVARIGVAQTTELNASASRPFSPPGTATAQHCDRRPRASPIDCGAPSLRSRVALLPVRIEALASLAPRAARCAPHPSRDAVSPREARGSLRSPLASRRSLRSRLATLDGARHHSSIRGSPVPDIPFTITLRRTRGRTASARPGEVVRGMRTC